MNLTTRQECILSAIVEEFIATGKPAGSKLIQSDKMIKCSPATIRQEMALLEQFGLIEKLHTSGGRKPSNAGYKYYVENLMNSKAETNPIKNIFETRDKNIEEVLAKATQVLSEATDLTAVLVSENTSEHLQAINFTPLNDNSAVAVIITDKGNVANKTFHVASKEQLKDLEIAMRLFNTRLVGEPINQVIQKLELLKPILEKQIKQVELVFKAMTNEFLRMATKDRVVAGRTNLIAANTFSSEQLTQIIGAIENHSSFEQFENEGAKILIGNDNGLGVDDVSVIQHQIAVGDTNAKIALVGHTRMDYKSISNVMDAVMKEIGEMF